MQEIEKLKSYFSGHKNVVLAFLFGSRASGKMRGASDWDIGVYFQPLKGIEIESTSKYVGEETMPADIERILKSEADVVILNRARPSLLFTVLNTGRPLVIKDRALYLKLFLRAHYEAVDFWNFVQGFWAIRQQAFTPTEDESINLVN